MARYEHRKYQRIANALRRQILDGKLTDRLPVQRDLAALFDTTRVTVRAACAVLEAEGLLYSVQGSGVYVNPHRRVCPTCQQPWPVTEPVR